MYNSHVNQTPRHTPVLLQESIALLSPTHGQSFLDVTLGLGGHAEAFLEKTAPDGVLHGIDTDEDNLRLAAEHLSRFGDRVRLYRANFQHIADIGVPPVDLVLADLGVSSPHFDLPER